MSLAAAQHPTMHFTAATRTLHSFVGRVCMLKTTACRPDLCMTHCLHHCRHVLHAGSGDDAARGGGALWGPVSISADGTAGSGDAAQNDRRDGALWGAPTMAESATEYDAAIGGVEAGVGDDTVWQPTTADAGADDADAAMRDNTSGHGGALWGQRGGTDAAAGEDAPAGWGGVLWGDGHSAVDAAAADETPAEEAGQGGALWGEYSNMSPAAGDELQAGGFAGQDGSIEAGYPSLEIAEEAGDGLAMEAQADDAGMFWGTADGGDDTSGSDPAAAGRGTGDDACDDDAAGFRSQAAAERDAVEQEPSADSDMLGCDAPEYDDVCADKAAADDLQPAATDVMEQLAVPQHAALDASTAAAAAASCSDGDD